MSPLEGNEEEFVDMQTIELLEVKEGWELIILTPSKLLVRLPVLLAVTKVGKNSCKLKNKIRQILCLLNQHNKTTRNICNILIKSVW